MTYKRANSTYQSNEPTYNINNTVYQVAGYSDNYNGTSGICRGTCKTHNLCTCGSKR